MRLLWAIALGACNNGPKPFVDIDKDVDRWDELGVPVVGPIAVKITLTSPKDDYATATGTASVSCSHCVLGDGGKLQPQLQPGTDPGAQAFVGDGIVFPAIDFGTIEGGANLKDGSGTIELHAGNPDSVEVEVSGTVKLANQLSDSTVDVHLRFRPSEKLRTTNQQAYNILSLTGAPVGAEGWFKVHITGPLSSTKRLAE